ncbi:MAG: molybdopterin-dependent oxidoreductase [Actinomycetota bacterium]
MNRVDKVLRKLEPPRVGPLREGTFTSPVRSSRTAAILGLALGVSFTVCFATGILSHLIQHPPGWFAWPPRPAGLYRISQGVHVATGIASIPLLLAKLWTVYPRLWSFPPVRSIAHAVERVSLVPLVGGSLFLLFSGVASITRWKPGSYSFPPAHYAAAWITIGGLIVHVGAKLTATRLALFRAGRAEDAEVAHGNDPSTALDGLSRRGFLAAVAATTTGLTLLTVGQTYRPLAWLGVLAPRDPRVGPQGVPVNMAASTAKVIDAALDPAYRLRVEGAVPEPLEFDLADLRALPQHEARLPIACVDGWSASALWRGVPVGELIALAGAGEGASVRVESLQGSTAAYGSSELDAAATADPDSLLALELNGEPLHIDHGFPCRLIGPNRPGVHQTKWVTTVVVL